MKIVRDAWVACINGLLLYNRAKDSFSEVIVHRDKQIIHPQVISILETKNGDIWMTTSGEGLISLKKEINSLLLKVKFRRTYAVLSLLIFLKIQITCFGLVLKTRDLTFIIRIQKKPDC